MQTEDTTLFSFIFKKQQPQPDKPKFQEVTFRKYWWVFLLLTFLVGSVYFNSLGNGLVSDDKGIATEGANLTKLSYIFSDPLSFVRSVIYAGIYSFVEANPLPYRVLNIFFHVGNTILVFLIVSLLARPKVGIITASLFAVHPILTEAVTWISGGPYSQYSFFFLLSFWCYILYSRYKDDKYYLASLGLFLAGLFSSNRVLTLAPIFFLYEYVWGDLKETWRKLLPYLGLSIFWGLVYVIQIGGRSSSLAEMTFSSGGTFNPLVQIPFALTTYLQLLFWPNELTFYHSDLAVTGLRLVEKWSGLLILVAGLLLSFKFKKEFFFWLGFFLISLAITLTPFKIAQIVAERYVYLGSIGILVPVGYLLAKFTDSKQLKLAVYLSIGLLVVGLGIRTIYRNFDWKNTDTLMLATIATTPESPRAQNNVGAYYFSQENYPKAIEHFQLAIENNPRFLDAYRNLVITYLKLEQKDKAKEAVEKGLKINPNNPFLLGLLQQIN